MACQRRAPWERVGNACRCSTKSVTCSRRSSIARPRSNSSWTTTATARASEHSARSTRCSEHQPRTTSSTTKTRRTFASATRTLVRWALADGSVIKRRWVRTAATCSAVAEATRPPRTTSWRCATAGSFGVVRFTARNAAKPAPCTAADEPANQRYRTLSRDRPARSGWKD